MDLKEEVTLHKTCWWKLEKEIADDPPSDRLTLVFLFHSTLPFIFSEINLFFRMFEFRIFECLYIFLGWESGHQLTTYITVGTWRSFNMRTVAYRGMVCHTLSVRWHLQNLFSCFWQHFCPIVSFFICRNLNLASFKKDIFVKKGYFSLTRSISVVMKWAFLV